MQYNKADEEIQWIKKCKYLASVKFFCDGRT